MSDSIISPQILPSERQIPQFQVETKSTATMATLQDTVNSLDLSEVPNKLKCAICSKLALNASKLPCCAQSICESCQSSLQGSCPVCEHSPLSPDLCVPHKALRNTIKAYLKTAEKKLAEEGKIQKSSAPESVSLPQQTATPEIKQEDSLAGLGGSSESLAQVTEHMSETVPIAPDDPQPSIELPTEEQIADDGPENDSTQAHDIEQSQQWTKEAANSTSRTTSLAPANQSMEQIPQRDMGFGMNGNGMPNMMNMNMNMGNNMDFNTMMPFMPNGMMNGIPNMNNMMGMPNMGMDPMSQGMFGSFGQGMGMNGMNMGFDPSGGQAMFEVWNNQNNSWNGPQNSHGNSFGNDMGGGYGSNTAYGYNMNHQGSFQQNQYPYNDFQHGYRGQGYMRSRGRGRGIYGWRGRGGYGSTGQGNYSNYQQEAYQQQPFDSTGQSPANGDHQNGQVDPPQTMEEQMKQIDDDFAPGGQEETNEALGIVAEETVRQGSDEKEDPVADQAMNESRTSHDDPTADDKDQEVDTIQSIPVLTSEEVSNPAGYGMNESMVVPVQSEVTSMPPPTAPLGPAAHFGRGQSGPGFRGRGYGRFATRGRGAFGSANGAVPPAAPLNAPTEPKGHGVVGAPTAPKALRKDVQPPIGPRNEGLQIMGRASLATSAAQVLDSHPDDANTSTDRQDEYPNGIHSRSRTRSRSPSRQSTSRHHREPESREISRDESGIGDRRNHKRRSSRYEAEDVNGHRDSRASSPASSRGESRRHKDKDRHSRHKHRSSHRSRHHHDEEDVDEAHGDQSGPSHSSRPKPSREPSTYESESKSGRRRAHRERDHDYDHEHNSKHESDRREDRHRDRKRSRRDRDEDEENDYDHESHHRSRRPKHDYTEKPVEPEKDPHTLEREARNRERMMKEQQRRDAMNADRGGSGKSRRDSRQERGHGSRRVNYKYEDENNAARVEHEREAARWK